MKLQLTLLLICRFFSPDGKDVTTEIKTCAIPGICSSETVNIGELIMTSNAMCCNSMLCNKETLPVLPLQRPNGKMCYSCKDNDCSHTVDCAGNEDQCIKAKVNILNKNVTMKGCANKSACSRTEFLTTSFVFYFGCCEGNLCNTAEIYTLSFFLMIVSLSSFIFFY